MKAKTLIIAEAGVNHNGDLDLAKELIDVAAECGADVVKFQTFKARQLVTKSAEKANYQIKTTDLQESQMEMLQRLEVSSEMHVALLSHCKRRSISFLSSGFDLNSLNYLNSLELDYFKIPSGELTNLPYLRRIGSFGKPVILSTGMATMDEVSASINVIEQAGVPRQNLTVLHCNTDYPTPIEDVNLNAMLSIRDTLNVPVGLSDHTAGVEVAIAAVAMGASIIEKHLTLNQNLPGPDHKASLEPNNFGVMVRAIRNIETAKGDGVKRPSQSEQKNITVIRKSLVASKRISLGERFSEDNITAKRPGMGISPMRWDEIIGQQASKNFEIDDFIELKKGNDLDEG